VETEKESGMKNESQYGLLLLQKHTDDQHPASVADILAF